MNNREVFEKWCKDNWTYANGKEDVWKAWQAAKAQDAELIAELNETITIKGILLDRMMLVLKNKDELIAELVEALSHYTNVVESVNDPNDWGTKVRDAGSFARDALAKVKGKV